MSLNLKCTTIKRPGGGAYMFIKGEWTSKHVLSFSSGLSLGMFNMHFVPIKLSQGFTAPAKVSSMLLIWWMGSNITATIWGQLVKGAYISLCIYVEDRRLNIYKDKVTMCVKKLILQFSATGSYCESTYTRIEHTNGKTNCPLTAKKEQTSLFVYPSTHNCYALFILPLLGQV